MYSITCASCAYIVLTVDVAWTLICEGRLCLCGGDQRSTSQPAERTERRLKLKLCPKTKVGAPSSGQYWSWHTISFLSHRQSFVLLLFLFVCLELAYCWHSSPLEGNFFFLAFFNLGPNRTVVALLCPLSGTASVWWMDKLSEPDSYLTHWLLQNHVRGVTLRSWLFILF